MNLTNKLVLIAFSTVFLNGCLSKHEIQVQRNHEAEKVRIEAEKVRNEAYKRKLKNLISSYGEMGAVKQNGWTIQFIKNPSEAVQLAAVKQDGFTIQFIKNPSEAVQIAAVEEYGCAIQYIKNPSEVVQLAAVEQNRYALRDIKNPSEAAQIAALKLYEHTIQDIKNPSEAVQLAAVKQDGFTLQYIKNPSEAVQLAAVEKNGWTIQFIKNPSEAVQLAAVKQYGQAIQYIKNPTPKMLLLAGRTAQISLSKVYFNASNKDISITFNNGELNIINHAKQFLKIISIAEYNNEKIYSLTPFSVPPEGVVTKSPYSAYFEVNSLNEKITFGYAIEYKVGNAPVKNLYKTKIYSLEDLIN